MDNPEFRVKQVICITVNIGKIDNAQITRSGTGTEYHAGKRQYKKKKFILMRSDTHYSSRLSARSSNRGETLFVALAPSDFNFSTLLTRLPLPSLSFFMASS